MPSSHEHQEPRVSDEGLKEILAGCEGVTKGPWEVDTFQAEGSYGKQTYFQVKAVNASPAFDVVYDTFNSTVAVIDEDCDEDGGVDRWDEQGRKNIAHAARLDPQTVASIVRELIERRAQPLPASGFAAGVEAAAKVLDVTIEYTSRKAREADAGSAERDLYRYTAQLATSDANVIRTLTESKSP